MRCLSYFPPPLSVSLLEILKAKWHYECFTEVTALWLHRASMRQASFIHFTEEKMETEEVTRLRPYSYQVTEWALNLGPQALGV